MKSSGRKSWEVVSPPAGTISCFLLTSASAGLLMGLFEASLLWTSPRIMPLLEPDVGYVIWFLAPLVDMIFFGLLGLLLGWLAARNQTRNLTGMLAAVNAGIFVMFVALRLRWMHARVILRPFDFIEDISVPLIWFVFGVVISLLIISWLGSRLGVFSHGLLARVRRPLAWGLAAAIAVSVAGISVFVARPSLFGTPAQAAAPPPSSPNIVFITLDTVRADHLSAYGYDRPTTPNLDRFARTGVLFENAIAPTSWTLASHASMFTGLLPQQHGADWAIPLASSPWTLAEILRSRGYQTAGFTANLLYLQKGWGIAQGFEHYEDDSSSFRHNLADTLLGTGIIQPVYQRFDEFDYFDREDAGQLNSRIFHWFHRRQQRPFFMFVNYFDTHNPYVPPAAYANRFGGVSVKLTRRFYRNLTGDKDAALLKAQNRRSVIAAYDDCLAYLDSQVKNLLDVLRQSPEWQNTIVIITSDHGEEFGKHGSYDHGRNLYRGVIHVPLIIAGPGVPQGLRIDHIAATRELFSTVLDLVGGGRTPFSRYSLARFWDPGFKPTTFDNAVVSELIPIDDLTAQYAMMSITTPEWEYIEHRDGNRELYHWTVDPNEQDNLAVSPTEQATLEDLQSRLVSLVSDAVGPWRGSPYMQALDKVGGTSRPNLLFPQPTQPGAADTPFRIGIAQAYFKSQEAAPTRPSQSERELIQSLPYQ
jgi:arylsulfatase A-like enzyme